MIGRATGAIQVTDEYPTSNQDSFISFAGTHPGVNSAHGQAFNSTFAGFISQAQFYLSRTAIVEGQLQAVLYTLTGTFGTNAIPDSTIAASALSDVISLSSFPDNQYTLVNFTFPQNGYRLSNNAVYGIAVVAFSGDFLGGGNLVVGIDASSSTHSGNRFAYSTAVGGWGSAAGDTIFSISADSSETFGGGGPTSQPPPTPLPTLPVQVGGVLPYLLVGVGAWLILRGRRK